jgi:hypothetical protein
MKKPKPRSTSPSEADDLRPEYDFDYRQARPNRFAAHVDSSCVVITLDPDVAQVFTTAESVNAVLRALISSMPRMSARA